MLVAQAEGTLGYFDCREFQNWSLKNSKGTFSCQRFNKPVLRPSKSAKQRKKQVDMAGANIACQEKEKINNQSWLKVKANTAPDPWQPWLAQGVVSFRVEVGWS